MDFDWIYKFVITCAVGSIAYFLKDIKKNTEDKIMQLQKDNKEFKIDVGTSNKENTEKIDQLKEDLGSYKEEVSCEYVRKTDYYQTHGEISKKIDKIYDILMDMNKKGCSH